MIFAVGQWSHAVAAVLFVLLACWQLFGGERRRAMAALAFAFVLTALWAGLAAALGPEDIVARAGETVRNLAFLGFMLVLLRGGLGEDRRPFVGLVYIALFLVGLSQAATDLLVGLTATSPDLQGLINASSAILHVIFGIGALLMIHALYTAAAPEARWGIRLPMIALAAMWAYDLNLYTLAWLSGKAPFELFALRGLLMIGLVPSFALAMRRRAEWKMKLSRKVTFRSLSLLAIAGYFLLMYFAVQAIDLFADGMAATIQVTLVFLMSAGAILLLPSARVRAWLKVKVAKHIFEHRYDYRAEWIRFNKTLALSGEDVEPIGERIVRAIAELTEASGGRLLVKEGPALRPAASWNWPGLEVPHSAGDESLALWLENSAHIIELDPFRCGDHGDPDTVATLVPGWMLAEDSAWALVPLIHNARLVGAVVLERPRVDRTLDWEDFDLLRIAGRQAASYLAEARSQDALAEARRFDEFNRRFAFILHDIKNLVSQLSLVARNAERHADNPEFRVDMVATLQDSVGKMNALLEKLAPKQRMKGAAPKPVSLRKIAEAVIARKQAEHAILLDDGKDCTALADAARLETALLHIVQNAIEASSAREPVRVAIDRIGDESAIIVTDRGQGMSEDFIRDALFRPFSSSKDSGFGIGAFEARTLIAEMGGRLDVESREGEGSRFTIVMPAVVAAQERIAS